MKIEHFALQVADPKSMAQWYVTHFDMRIRRALEAPTCTHFLAASDDAVLVEIYHNPAASLPDYPSMHPLLMHLAFCCEDIAGTVSRLVEAGATLVAGPEITPAGDELVMLRDPWGLAVQLVKRNNPMLNA